MDIAQQAQQQPAQRVAVATADTIHIVNAIWKYSETHDHEAIWKATWI